MTQEERLDELVRVLCEDSGQYRGLKVREQDRRTVLRSLMNIRMPKPLPEEFLEIQDEFLQQEAKEKGIVSWEDIPTVKEVYGSLHPAAGRISIWQGDITRLAVSGIVNAANSRMLGCFVPCHGCIDNAIHSAAGLQLREECWSIMKNQGYEEPVGKAKITKGYNLPCRYVLHTVGPYISGNVTERDCRLLKSCYESCLELAEEYGLESIAFCCISTGEFHFPNERAARIGVEAVSRWLEHSKLQRVIFNVFRDYDRRIYEKRLCYMDGLS